MGLLRHAHATPDGVLASDALSILRAAVGQDVLFACGSCE
jgi:hypothetical protein